MIRRYAALVIMLAILVGFVGGGRAYSPISGVPDKALIQVYIQTPAELVQFETTGLPVFTQLNGSQGHYILTGGNEEHLKILHEAGLIYVILDTDLSGGSYYLVYPVPNQPHLNWETLGEVLLDDGMQRLIRTTPAQAETLAQSGLEIQYLTLTPKPLSPRRDQPSFPTIVDPDPTIQSMIDQVTIPVVQNWTGGLSGEWPVMVGGNPYTLATRNTYSGTPIQKATQYIGEQLAAFGLNVTYHPWGGATYPNVIGELPGQVNPDEIYIIGAHLDDMPISALAPGADDNASGSVATLLAADIFTEYSWGCTLRFAFWTGEEQGLLGSNAYAQQAYNTGENIAGYLNLDMIAWNTGGSNPNIDLHTNSSLPATLSLAQLFSDVITAYSLDLNPEIISNGTGFSDHASFWQYGYTSILAIEDYYGTGDFNPYYHTVNDDMTNFQDWPYYLDFVKASLATFVHMTNCLIPGGMGYQNGNISAASGGASIPDAQIVAENPEGQTYTALTNENGYYTHTLPADVYTVTASAYGYLPETVTGIQVVTETVTTADLYLETAPTYLVSGTVIEAGTGLPLLAQIRALPTMPVWTDPATGHYSLTLPLGTYTLEVTAEAHQPNQRTVLIDHNQTQDFTLDSLACILLVDDDNNAPDVRAYFTNALNTLGYDYEVFDLGGGSANGPALTDLQGYNAVFWFSGDKYGGSAGPNNTDETALSAYLDGGGRLFLSSQDYLFDAGLTPFGQNYLGIGSYTEDAGNATVKYGVAGDPIGGGLGPYPLTYPADFSDFGDVVNPVAPGSVAFRSSAAGGNNLDLDRDGGAWKTVFFGTDWVPIYNNQAGNGEAVLEQIVEWFGGCDRIPDITVSPTELSMIRPSDTTAESVLQIGNVGNGVLAWSMSEQPSVSWLDEAISSGGVMPGATVPITITFDTAGLGEGGYTTTLQITSNDPDTLLIQIAVNLTIFSLCDPPNDLNFSWTPLDPLVGQPITFTAAVTGTEPITLTWDFGDSDVGAGVMITHTYVQTGTFIVTLTSENCCGLDSIFHPIMVYAVPPPAFKWVLYLPIIYCQ